MSSKSVCMLLASIALALVAVSGQAAEALKTQSQTLARVKSDRDSNVGRLMAIVDTAGEIKSLRFEMKHQDTKQTTTLNYSMKQIASAEGAVLVEAAGHKALILKGSVDAKTGVGKFNVIYLTDAFQNTYASCRAVVARSTEGKWQILNVSTKKRVDELFVQTHGTGITTIKGICN